MSAVTATTRAVNGAKLLEATGYNRHLCASIIAGQDNWQELLDSLLPQQRKNVAIAVYEIRTALGLEADHALDICQGTE